PSPLSCPCGSSSRSPIHLRAASRSSWPMDVVSASQPGSIPKPSCASSNCSKKEASHAELASHGPHLALSPTGRPSKIIRQLGGLGAGWAPGRSTLGGHLRLPQQVRRPDQAPALGGGRLCDLVQATGERKLPLPCRGGRRRAGRGPRGGPDHAPGGR